MKTYFLLTMADQAVQILECQKGIDSETEIARLSGVVAWRPFDPKTEAPADRTFRNAWSCQGAGRPLGVCMDTARNIHRDRMRQVRAPQLAKLDVEYQRADEAGDIERKKEIATQKQQLRDCTAHPGIDAAQTPGELTAVWPELLERAPMSMPVPVKVLHQPSPDDLVRATQEALQEIEMPLGIREPYSLKDLLESATEDDGKPIVIPPLPAEAVIEPPVRPLPPVPVEDALSEATRRRAAKATVRKAVAEVMKLTSDQQFKYEQALLVLNKNVEAMSEVKMLAAIEGVTVEEWARRTTTQHETRRRRGAQVWALEAQALKDIDAARGDDIDAVARDAVLEIIGEDE